MINSRGSTQCMLCLGAYAILLDAIVVAIVVMELGAAVRILHVPGSVRP
jgi:hypothetical protein